MSKTLRVRLDYGRQGLDVELPADRLVGGDAALDFVNTDVVSQHDRATDVLRSGREFLDWCAFAGLDAPRSSFALSPSAQIALVAAAALLSGCATYSYDQYGRAYYYDQFGNVVYPSDYGPYAYNRYYSYRYDPYYDRYYYYRPW